MLTEKIITIAFIWLLSAIGLYCIYASRKTTKKVFLILTVAFLLVAPVYYTCHQYPDLWFIYHHLEFPIKKQYVDKQQIQPDEYLDDFHEIYDKVKRYYQLEKAKGISLEKLKADCIAEISKAHSNQEYFLALQKFFAGLKNMHTILIYKQYIAHAIAEWRCGSLYVIYNKTGLPFQTGDEITEVDGIPSQDWQKRMMDYTIASTDEARMKNTADYVFSSYTDTTRTLRISRKDSVFTVKVPLNKTIADISRHNQKVIKKEDENLAHQKQTEKTKDVGRLTLKNLSDESVQRFIRQYQIVRDCPYLILDLSENSGGKRNNAIRLAKLLLKRPYSIAADKTVYPDTLSYKGKLYVMISNSTFSASERLADMLKATQSATLVGTNTGGDFCVTMLKFVTSHDTYFAVGYGKPQTTLYGQKTEGIGVAPDIRIEESPGLSNKLNTLLNVYKLILTDNAKQYQHL